MIRFLDKEREMALLPQLFDLLYENMKEIAPTELDYELEKAHWLSCVEPALAKDPRKIVLIFAGPELAGFMQYYVNAGIFMVEEVQIRRDYQASSMITALWKFMGQIIPADTECIEAYADYRNLKSQRLMQKLGMEPVGRTADDQYIHFRGNYPIGIKKTVRLLS
jgi:hypothetical protein